MYFYGKLIKSTETPTRMADDDQPYNFTVLAFSGKVLRDAATEYVFERNHNIIHTLKKHLYSSDFIEGVEGLGCMYFDNIKEFKEFFNETTNMG